MKDSITQSGLGSVSAKENRKETVLKAACGGLFVGVSVAAMLFNSAMHNPTIFILSGIVGVLGGCGLIASALIESK